MSFNLDHQLPFRVDQVSESKSFIIGFRSAWFRCKIKSIRFRKRQIWYSLEFFDFPDEKVRWTKLYQKPFQQPDQAHRKSKMELMVRPAFPPFFRKSQLPEILPSSDVIAIINDNWKVGNFVDWWYDGCYWSGRVSQLLEDDKVLIDLPEPPIGEGKSYVALCRDLRPSLDWTPENGWTVPAPKECVNFCSCAELIYQSSHETISMRTDTQDDGSLEGKPNCSASDELSDRSSVPTKAPSGEDLASPTDPIEKIHISGNNAVGVPRKVLPPRVHLDSLERMWIGETNRTASLRLPDSLESSIIRLETLAQKIKWLKGLLELGFEWSNAMKPSWNFVENCASFK